MGSNYISLFIFLTLSRFISNLLNSSPCLFWFFSFIYESSKHIFKCSDWLSPEPPKTYKDNYKVAKCIVFQNPEILSWILKLNTKHSAFQVPFSFEYFTYALQKIHEQTFSLNSCDLCSTDKSTNRWISEYTYSQIMKVKF